MKLNKRIATLEMNMSLSSEYLSELSRQYVEQVNYLETIYPILKFDNFAKILWYILHFESKVEILI